MLIDTHVHSKPASMCGWVPSADVPALFKNKGFSGFVLTNHFAPAHLEKLANDYADMKKAYLNEYLIAKSAGEEIGIKVFLGMEIAISDKYKDAETGEMKDFHPEFLVIGLTPEKLLDFPYIFNDNQEKLFEFANSEGLLIFQTHPYRIEHNMHPANGKLMHGVEIYNGHPNFLSRKEEAKAFADSFNLRYIAGSDMHVEKQAGTAGIDIPPTIENSVDLCSFLKENRYKKLFPDKFIIEF